MTNAKALLLATLVLVGMIVSPVLAESYLPTGDFVLDSTPETFTGIKNITYDASPIGHRISQIEFSCDTDQYINFTLYYGANSTVEGSASNNIVSILPPITQSIVTLNGVSKSYDYIDIQPLFDFYFTGYARGSETNVTGFLVYSAGYGGFDNDLAVFYQVNNIAVNTIYRVDISGPQTFTITIRHAPAESVSEGTGKNVLDVINEWVQFAISLGSTLIGFLVGSFYWIKFIFVDNLLLTIALYFSVSMAVAATRSRDIFQFYRRFLGDQRKLFEFILYLWQALINLIATFRGIFRI